MHKKFMIWFVVAVILIGPIGQFFIFRYTPLYNLNLLTELYNDAAWVTGKPKVAIMGSSHARYHIIPKEISKLNKKYQLEDIVNIGENAASPFEMYTTFIKNKEKFLDLEIVYYTLEPHILGEKYYFHNPYEKIFLNYHQWNYMEKKDGRVKSYFFPFHIFLESLRFGTLDRSNTNGYSPLKHREFNTYTIDKVVNQIYATLELFPVSVYAIKYLKKIKSALNNQGVKFIFVLTPTYTFQKYYAKGAKPFDDMLIGMLNDSLGDSCVVGSFWPEDYNLKYVDFKDDTHLAHSGALKFTRTLFSDIEAHKTLDPMPIQNTFLYRRSGIDADQYTKKLIMELKPGKLRWKGGKNVTMELDVQCLSLSAIDVDKNVYIHTKFNDIKEVDSVVLSICPPKEKLKMLGVTLRNQTQYAHFFIKPNDFNDGEIELSSMHVSKMSEGFVFDTFNSMTIRAYPKGTTEITDFRVNSIKFFGSSG